MGIRGKVSRFEAMDRNGICSGPYLQEKRMRRSAEDFVRARVEGSQRRMGGRSTNEDERRIEEFRRNGGRGKGGRRRRSEGTGQRVLKVGKVKGRIIFRSGGGLGRKDKGSPIEGFCRGKV